MWLCQVDRRTGLVKTRSADLPCFTVRAQGMGDLLAGPVFLLLCEEGPTGRDGDWADEVSGRCWSGKPTRPAG